MLLYENLSLIQDIRKFFYQHKNNKVIYHNWNHCLTTGVRAVYLYKKGNNFFDEVDCNSLFIASLFHDIGYSLENSDSENIKTAINLFNSYYEQSKFKNIDLNISLIRNLIKATEYPHNKTNDTLSQVIQDADLTQRWDRDIDLILKQLEAENNFVLDKDFPPDELLNLNISVRTNNFKDSLNIYKNFSKKILDTYRDYGILY